MFTSPSPRLKTAPFSRNSYALAGLLVAVCCMVFGFATFSSQAVGSQDKAGETAGQAATTGRSLSLDERVKYQRAVEEVYWRHTAWPEQSARPKPDLDAVTPLAATRAKVEDTLRKSGALAELWGRPVTPEQLQAEMARMARESRQPEVLRELHQALDNDPFLIAEVLARPILVERLVRNFYAYDDRFHAAVRERAQAQEAHATAAGMRRMGGEFSETQTVKVAQQARPRILSAPDKTATEAFFVDEADKAEKAEEEPTLKLTAAEWDAEMSRLKAVFDAPDDERLSAHAATARLSQGRVSGLREDADSFYIAAITEKTDARLKVARVEWRKTGFDSWWAGAQGKYAAQPAAAGNFAYQMAEVNQASSGADDTWTPTQALPVVTGSAIWTGSEMIIWGSQSSTGGRANSGARYNPATDTWAPTSTVNAPTPRRAHTAVWSGSEMIIWGGCGQLSNFCGLSDGGRYNPATDTWTPTSTVNAPIGRSSHTGVWTGSKMIVWGGCSHGYYNQCSSLSTGGVYDPASDSWTPTSGTGVPSPRSSHRAVWTGTEMIVWGSSNTGGRYNPASDSWRPTNTFNAPSARGNFTAVWTGTEMIIWGGYEGNSVPLNTGGRYNPANDTWTPTSTAGAPVARFGHTAVWTGSEMIVYAGDLRNGATNNDSNSGGRYNPATDTWTQTSTLDAPSKNGHVAVWTGSEMLVWSISNLKEGGRYNPSSDSWMPINNDDSVPPVDLGVWSGTEMLVWGPNYGCSGCGSSGGRYNPATYSWRPMNGAYAPPAGSSGRPNTAVWTGTEMIVWGAYEGAPGTPAEGGRYNPFTDNWTRVSTVNAPSPRVTHTAVWTGTEMIVWSGTDATGGRYNPKTDTWTPTSTVNAPTGRTYHTAVWTGSEMVVWGGVDTSSRLHLNTGGRYNPASDSWTPTSTAGAPSERRFHSAVWTGSEMVVWGGTTGDYNSSSGFLNTGGRYNPATDSWQPTSLVGAPAARMSHRAVWTGSMMLVWGGRAQGRVYTAAVYTGGRYNPQADAWTPMSTISAPAGRSDHLAIWTGTGMIVWGGITEDGAATHGAIYNASGAAAGNSPPSISILKPGEGETFESGTNVFINLATSDNDGTVSSVHFYANDKLIGTDSVAPFNLIWYEVRGGSYALTAVATDNAGGMATSSPVHINVNPSSAPPTCLLTSPVNGATYTEPATVTVTANAQANRDRTLTKVQFYDGTTPLGTYTNGPYTFDWSNLPAGTHSFSVRCTDNAGQTSESPTSVVTINPSGPYFRITGQIVDSRGYAQPNLRVRLDSSASSTPQFINTNLNGYYQFGNLQSGANYTVTPESAVYSFSPRSEYYPALGQNQDNGIFVATPNGYSISGRLTDTRGNALYPATVNLSGSATASTSTDINGNYFFSNLAAGGNYTIQPYKNLYNFEPPFRTFNGLAASQTSDFVGSTAPSQSRVNFALASNGGVATASSVTTGEEAPGMDFSPASVINGDHKGLNWERGGGWRDGTESTYPDWVQVEFNGSKTIDQINVFTIQDAYSNPSEPTETMTFSSYGVTAFDVQYWDGAQWLTVPGGGVANNNLVWRKLVFASLSTSKIRVRINAALAGRSRIVEVEAWGSSAPAPARTNFALATNGGTALASSTTSAAESGGMDFSPASVINGDRKGLNWERGGGWRDGTESAYPDWIEVDFSGNKAVNEINVFTIQDSYANPSEPTETMTFSSYGVTAFDVQYWDGAQWLTVPGGGVTGNNLVWRKLTFADVTTSKIRVRVTAALAGRSRIVEVEAWGPSQPVTPPRTNFALAANGGTASASSTTDVSEGIGTFPASSLINGDRKGLNWGNGGGWRDATDYAYPDWVQVDFNGSKTITEISVFTIQDAYDNPSEPTDAMKFGLYGVTAFDVQYWDGAQWLTVPGGSVTGNNSVKRTFTFPAITTGKIRVLINNAFAGRSRLAEIEAYN